MQNKLWEWLCVGKVSLCSQLPFWLEISYLEYNFSRSRLAMEHKLLWSYILRRDICGSVLLVLCFVLFVFFLLKTIRWSSINCWFCWWTRPKVTFIVHETQGWHKHTSIHQNWVHGIGSSFDLECLIQNKTCSRAG